MPDHESQALQSGGRDLFHLTSCSKCDLDWIEAFYNGCETVQNVHTACAIFLLSTGRPGVWNSTILSAGLDIRRVISLPSSPLCAGLSSISLQHSLWAVFSNTPRWFLKTCWFNISSIKKNRFPSDIILQSYTNVEFPSLFLLTLALLKSCGCALVLLHNIRSFPLSKIYTAML